MAPLSYISVGRRHLGTSVRPNQAGADHAA
jgi:hypothetical protein